MDGRRETVHHSEAIDRQLSGSATTPMIRPRPKLEALATIATTSGCPSRLEVTSRLVADGWQPELRWSGPDRARARWHRRPGGNAGFRRGRAAVFPRPWTRRSDRRATDNQASMKSPGERRVRAVAQHRRAPSAPDALARQPRRADRRPARAGSVPIARQTPPPPRRDPPSRARTIALRQLHLLHRRGPGRQRGSAPAGEPCSPPSADR